MKVYHGRPAGCGQFPPQRLLETTRRLTILALLAFGWSATTSYANGIDADGFLTTLEKERGKISTYSAQFVQKKTVALFDEEKVSTGRVLFKAPQQMIWKYEAPDKTQMRIDRKAVSFYFPALEQIEVYPSESGPSPFFFAFEATADEIKENFSVSELACDDEGLDRIRLSPKSDPLASQLRSITLWLGEADYLPRKIVIDETSGDTTEIKLSDVRVNQPIAEEELKFDAPEGTEVIEAGTDNF